ncbi:MAG: hypothetical protein Q9195_008975 [Heterodermia aff. obscurata]
MSEEIKNASVAVPRAMVSSIMLNGSMSFGMLLAVLFSIGDVNSVLGSNTGYPFLAILQQGVSSIRGALAMAAMITTLAIVATISWVASASRMLWSFARDRGIPGWRTVCSVEKRSSIPVIAILVTTVTACLLSLINIGSSVAFNDVVSLSINGLYTLYLIGNSLLLWRRLAGHVSIPSESAHGGRGSKQFPRGPWRLPEPIGTINNVFGCGFLVVILIFSCFLAGKNPTPSNMN